MRQLLLDAQLGPRRAGAPVVLRLENANGDVVRRQLATAAEQRRQLAELDQVRAELDTARTRLHGIFGGAPPTSAAPVAAPDDKVQRSVARTVAALDAFLATVG